MSVKPQSSLLSKQMLVPAILQSVQKLDPRKQWGNPVMFIVELGSLMTTVLALMALGGTGESSFGFVAAISL